MKKNPTVLGMNAFGWAHVIYGAPYDLDAILRHAQKLKFDGVELFGMPEDYPLKKPDQLSLKKRIEAYGLSVTSLQSLPGGLGNGHPASAYTICRKQYIDYIKDMLDLAGTFGCLTMGVWAGEMIGTGPNELCTSYLVDVYGTCAELAAKAGIPLCLEAEPVQLVNTPETWFRILEGVNSRFLRALCDFSHINVLSRGKPLDLLKRLQPYIGYLHLCGNDGTCTKIESRSSTHLALGEGSMDWKAMLGQILDSGYEGVLDIDAWEHADPFGVTEVSKKKLDGFLAKR
jgi:sugar phosphate isomerase/epimerase